MIGRKSVGPDLPARLEALAAGLDLSEGRLDPDAVATGRQVELKANERLRHGTTHTLVALLGATGSGKSSVANALIGSDVATTGVRRPTTSSTLAAVFGPDDAGQLLHWLEVGNRHLVAGESSLDGLVLLDVPDHDSVAVSHRLEMERIAEHADLLLWVTDTEKYGDKAMHEYLRTLSNHGAVMVLVLNKIDQLDDAGTSAVEADFRRLVIDDGVDVPTVVPVSTVTHDGVADLRHHLETAVEEQRAMVERLSADVRVAADELLAGVGDGSATIDRRVEKALVSDLVDGAGIEVVTSAVAAGHVRDATARTGWPFTRWLRKLRPHPLRKLHLGDGSGGRSSLPAPTRAQAARVQAAVRDAADDVTDHLDSSWSINIREAATPDERVLRDRLDQAVANAVRGQRQAAPRWWTVVGVIQVLLAVATVVGALWLGALAVMAYLQLPDVATPDVGGIPVPTGLLVLAPLLGWLLALLSRRLAVVGGKRRARATKRKAEGEVEAVAHELVLGPMQAELDTRDRLRDYLLVAAGR